MGIKLNDKIVHKLVDNYEILEGSADELYFRIGIGIIKLNDLEERLQRKKEEKKYDIFSWLKPKEKKGDFVINDSDDGKYKYVIAGCCNPIPGDSVVGFLSSDGTITVHKKTCDVANDMAAKHGDRIVMPEWSGDECTSFLVRLSLKGYDRIGIINDITRYISLVMSVNIRRLDISTEDGVFEGFIDLYVRDKRDLDKLVKKLAKIEGIQNVIRIDL